MQFTCPVARRTYIRFLFLTLGCEAATVINIRLEIQIVATQLKKKWQSCIRTLMNLQKVSLKWRLNRNTVRSCCTFHSKLRFILLK